ncbi:MAG: UMP kinase [Clostridia bacterium]|nr:UMP kinase [Clostridia bacterium]
MEKAVYKRVLIKISGEALSKDGNPLDDGIIAGVVSQIKKIREMGVEVGIVIGGGNFWRGRQGKSMDRSTADHMGMLATVINALALQDAFEKEGLQTRVMTALEIARVAEPYIQRRAVRHLEKGRVVIFACGTGNPYFSTDTGAALRANEIGAEVMLLAKNVDAVYTADPKKDPNAKRITDMPYIDLLAHNLTVMDAAAVSLCMENKLPVLVFGLNVEDGIVKACKGENLGTLIH